MTALRLALLCALATLLCAGSLRADDDDDDEDEQPPIRHVTVHKDSKDGPSSSSAPVSNGLPNDGPGVDLRAAFNYGQGPVQDRSLAPFEAFPFFLMNNSLVFGDFRFFPTIEGTFGGNVGAGSRYYLPAWDRIFGASLWYDADGTRDLYFQQLGLSLETYGTFFDFRTNFYLPVGDTMPQSSLGAVNGSARFVGDNIVYDQLSNYLAAMRGLDMEAGFLLPGHFAHDHGIRAYGGWYYYNDSQGDHILGASARLQANIVSGLDAAVQITDDNYFNLRAFANISWTFGPLHRSQLSQDTAKGRFGEHVTRNYTVLVTPQSQVNSGVMAIDPATGHPYVVAHVDSNASPGGNGDVNNPFQTITAAQAGLAGADLIFVHAGSIFHGTAAAVVMNSGQSILGDGNGERQFLPVSRVGSILLPHGPTTGSLPVLDSTSGATVTLANNVTFSGFTITNSGGPGIIGNGVGNVLVRDVTVSHSGSDGIQLNNATGATIFDNVTIANSVGNGLTINGGSPGVQFIGTISSSQGHDLLVENTNTGTLIDMTGAQFTGGGSQGILLSNVAGTVNFNNLLEPDTAGPGVAILGGSGTFNFFGTTIVAGAGGPSILIQNLGSSGSVAFNNVSIANRHDEGLVIDNSSGSVSVAGTTTVTNEQGVSASAIDIKNSSGNASFGGVVSVVNSTGNPGVSLTNNTGTTSFNNLDITSANGTALFANNAGALIINSSQKANAGGTIQAANGTAVDIEGTSLAVNLQSVSSSGATVGIKLANDGGTFAVLGNSNGAAGSGGVIQGAGTGVLLQNVGVVGLQSMVLTGNGLGIQSQNVSTLGISNSQISNSSTFGIDALDTKTLVVANSTFVGNGATNIRSQYDQINSYAVSIIGSTLTSSAGDNVFIQSLGGASGATANLTVQGDAFRNTTFGTDAVNVNWAGNFSATVSQNAFLVNGGTNEGVHINNTASTGLTTLSYTNNIFTSEGGTDTALHVITAGAAQMNIASNVVQFGATSGTGFRFSLGSSSSVSITSNSILDTTDGATGIQFDSIIAPSNVVISGNSIQLANSGNLLDRGIIFSSVTDQNNGNVTFMVNLSGPQNNTVQGADTPFFVPAATTTGQIMVNGTLMP